MDHRRISILLVSAKRWPLAARLAMVLVREGCRVEAVCPSGHPLEQVAGLEGLVHYSGIDPLAALRRALLERPKALVVPCDDGVVAQLHALHASEPLLRAAIERSLGPASSFPFVRSRHALQATARQLGIQVPRTGIVRDADDLKSWHKTYDGCSVLKVDGSCGGQGVRICESLDEAMAAWKSLGAKPPFTTALKRLLIDRDPLALWDHQAVRQREVTVQEFIRGRPANLMMACWGGRVLSLVSVEVVVSEGPTGAATIVRPIVNEAMTKAAHALAHGLGLSGFYGLDFVIQAGTGIPFLIELNPRCTQLGHLDLPGQANLASALCAAVRGERPRPSRNAIRSATIAIFPQVLTASGGSRHVREAYLDVPWENPKLVRELQREPWAQRQWLAKIYLALRPLRWAEPTVHADSSQGEPSDYRNSTFDLFAVTQAAQRA